MARSYARLLTSIWRDPDFTALSGEAQRLYLVLLSQPELNACGVLPLRPKLWATFANNTPRAKIEAALRELSGLLVVDDATDEVLVRSFMRHETLTQPALVKSACRLFDTIHSATIREALVNTLPRGMRGGFPEGYLEASLGDIKEGVAEALADPLAYPPIDPPVDPGVRDATRPMPGSLIPDPGSLNTEPLGLAIVTTPVVTFEEFWAEYPRKVGVGAARTSWAKACKIATGDEILAGLRAQLSTLRAKSSEYQPHAATWLNQERWKDIPDRPQPFGKSTGALERAMGLA